MKVALSMIIFALLIVLQNVKLPEAQGYCRDPGCGPGATFNQYACKCVNYTKSTCPNDTSELVDRRGRCSCQEAIHPECDEGYTLFPDSCICKIRVAPTCPNGTKLIPQNAICLGTDEPTCPYGYRKVGCKCVRTVDRECENGELSARDCKCKITYPPKCPGQGCSLSTNGECACQRNDSRPFRCYYSRRCSGQVYYVSDIAECCYHWPSDYDGDQSVAPPRTYRYLKYYSYNNQRGQCYNCAYYHYSQRLG